MVVLGIDPGVATVGFGIIQVEKQRYTPINFGVITTPAGIPLAERLLQISKDMVQLLERFQPDEMAVEELFFSKNVTTGISVAHGRGIILLEGQRYGLPIYEYTPNQVKQAVTGYGKAEKKQVMSMTQRLLKLNKLPRPDDAADALAVAICHGRSATSLLNQDKSFDATKYNTR